MKPTVRVKVCGITRPEDAERSVRLGATMIGLNFYPPSPRAISVERGREIAEAVAGRARLVGVFVDRPGDEVRAIDRALGLDLLQFHGDEGPEVLAAFGRRAIKVFRSGENLAGVDLEAYPEAWGFLFDIRHPKLYGGTGVAWSYGALAALSTPRRYFVSGGIRPGNARQAAAASGAWGIDVCSGVEATPGIKDHEAMKRLFREISDG